MPQHRVPETKDYLKLALLAFHSHSLSQDITHGPFFLPAISVPLISPGNPGQLLISSSFICFNNEYPSMPWAPLRQLPGCSAKWCYKQLPCRAAPTPSKRKNKHNGLPTILMCPHLRFLIPRPGSEIHTIPTPFNGGDIR